MNSQDGQGLEPGYLFEGKYKILRELGRGGFGMVYLAFQESMDRQVALKVLRASAVAAASSARERFHREVKIISKLKHPNTVTIHDFGETVDGGLYMILEYVEGEELKQILKREGAQEAERATAICLQIARSLAEAHRVGVVHRDLKPANIMLTQFGTEKDFIKVLDFGVARLLDPKTTDLTSVGLPDGERELIGTPRYMSPEQVRGESLTGRSDIYGLGLILYEVLSGEPAVQGETTMGLITQQISPEPLNLPALRGLHPRLQDIIRIATAKPVNDRFHDAEQMAIALDDAMQQMRMESGYGGTSTSNEMLAYQTNNQNWQQSTPSGQWQQANQFAPPSGQFNQQQPNQFAPMSGQFNQQNQGQFNQQNHGQYNPNQGQFNQQNQFNQPSGQFPVQQPQASGQFQNFQPQPGFSQPIPISNNSDPVNPVNWDPQSNSGISFDGDFQPTVERGSLDPSILRSYDAQGMKSGEFNTALPPVPADEDPFAPPPLEGNESRPSQADGLSAPSEPLVDESGRPHRGRASHMAREESMVDFALGIIKICVLTTTLLLASYTAFIIVGAMMADFASGAIRLGVALLAAAGLPIMSAIVENKNRERVRVVEQFITKASRILFAGTVFCLGAAIIGSVALPTQVVRSIRADANWFLSGDDASGFPKLNKQYSEELAEVVATVGAAVGTYNAQEALGIQRRKGQTTPLPTRPGKSSLPKSTRPSSGKKKVKDDYVKW